jgi:ribosome-binding protein aMBF1 (putative translation factor)
MTHSTERRPDMTADQSSYDELARERRDRPDFREGCAEAPRAYLIGLAVRDRRLALGLSQVEMAARAGMTPPALSRLEAGGVIPTIPFARANLRRPRRQPHRQDLATRRLKDRTGSPHHPDLRDDSASGERC